MHVKKTIKIFRDKIALILVKYENSVKIIKTKKAFNLLKALLLVVTSTGFKPNRQSIDNIEVQPFTY